MSTTKTEQRSPVAELLADRNFRRYWFAQILVFGSNGTLRFVFVWLIVTLTDWPSAEGLTGIALGLPALLLALPAGLGLIAPTGGSSRCSGSARRRC